MLMSSHPRYRSLSSSSVVHHPDANRGVPARTLHQAGSTQWAWPSVSTYSGGFVALGHRHRQHGTLIELPSVVCRHNASVAMVGPEVLGPASCRAHTLSCSATTSTSSTSIPTISRTTHRSSNGRSIGLTSGGSSGAAVPCSVPDGRRGLATSTSTSTSTATATSGLLLGRTARPLVTGSGLLRGGGVICGSTNNASSSSSSGSGSGADSARGLSAWSAGSAPASSPSSGGGGGGGSGRGNGGSSSDSEAGRGLPPPVIISPVPLRVVVVGWMGSSRRYLNKYGALWARSGDHEVLLLRPSVVQTLVRWRGVVVAGRDIDRVARLHRENPAMPTVYHVFSTGGFIHAGTMWRWMDEVEDVAQRRDLLEEVRGIIFDSAPAAVNPEMAARAIVSAVTNTPAEDLAYGMPGVQGALLSGTRSFLDSYLKTRGVKMRGEEVYDAWYNLAPTCPQLYMYSDADPLVPPSDVERYMAVQEGRGVDVSSHLFSGSGHVEHYRRHPHEYAFQISSFLARALQDW